MELEESPGVDFFVLLESIQEFNGVPPGVNLKKIAVGSQRGWGRAAFGAVLPLACPPLGDGVDVLGNRPLLNNTRGK